MLELDPMPALVKLHLKNGVRILVWGSRSSTEQGDVLLAEGLKPYHQLIQRVQFAGVGLAETNVRDRMGQGLLRLLFAFTLFRILFSGFQWLVAHVRTHSAARQPALVLSSVYTKPYSN